MRFLARRNGRKAFEKLDPAVRAITFYAEDGGSWPHFEPIVAELIGPRQRDVCYLTSRPDDPVLTRPEPRLHAFEIGDGVGRAFCFKTMEAGVLVATVPQLGIPVLPRSQRAEELGSSYVYVFHSMASTHMIYEPDGFDHYDTVLCVGPYMIDEIRRREELVGLVPKELVEHGYGRLDSILAQAEAAGDAPIERNDRTVVLIAPSWGPTCIFETCGPGLVRELLRAGFRVIARPHPMTLRKTPRAVDALRDEFGGDSAFSVDDDVSAQESLLRCDVMISDWSGAALEYAFGRERPVLFVDVARKVNNPGYRELGLEPFESSVRDRIGRIVAPDDLGSVPRMVHELVEEADRYAQGIRATRAENVFNVGSSGAVAAEVIARKADHYLQRHGLVR